MRVVKIEMEQPARCYTSMSPMASMKSTDNGARAKDGQSLGRYRQVRTTQIGGNGSFLQWLVLIMKAFRAHLVRIT